MVFTVQLKLPPALTSAVVQAGLLFVPACDWLLAFDWLSAVVGVVMEEEEEGLRALGNGVLDTLEPYSRGGILECDHDTEPR